MIEHLGYSLIEIISDIQLLTSAEYKICINSLPTQLKVSINKQMFSLVWDYIAQKIDIKENICD